MDRRHSRRRIIDNTSVPDNRRKERKVSFDTDCVFTTTIYIKDLQNSNNDENDGHEVLNSCGTPTLQTPKCNETNIEQTEHSNQTENDKGILTDETSSRMGNRLHKDEGDRISQANSNSATFCSSQSVSDRLDEVCRTSVNYDDAVVGELNYCNVAARRVSFGGLFPTIREEINRGQDSKDYMLPWRSIDKDETNRITRTKHRRSSVQNTKKETDNCNNTIDVQIDKTQKHTPVYRHADGVSDISSVFDEDCTFQKTNVKHGLETKDPFSIELEKTRPSVDYREDETISSLFAHIFERLESRGTDSPLLDTISLFDGIVDDANSENEDNNEEAYSNLMDGPDGAPRLLSVEEKWQIIFNEKTRAPIYAVGQYIEYLTQYVNGKNAAARDKDRISPISYLLRKLKLDLKMSYDSFVEEFLKPENSGMALLLKLLKFIQNTGTQQSGSANKTQLKNYKKTLTDEHDCLLCIKFALRIKSALSDLLAVNYGLETIAMSLLSSFTKSRGTAIEILTITLSAAEGFSRTLDSFTYVQLKIGEPVRFKSLINMMNMDSLHNIVFKVSGMKFMNCLLDAASNLNVRVFLQHELETAGLDIHYMMEKTTATGLEYDDLRHELEEWNRKFIRVDEIFAKKNLTTPKPDPSQQNVIEELQKKVKMLTLEKATLDQKLQATRASLEKSNEELHKRIPTCDKETQTPQSLIETRDVSCQCSNTTEPVERANPLFNIQLAGAWQGPETSPNDVSNTLAIFEDHTKEDEVDENGVAKVKQWLDSQNDLQVRNDTLKAIKDITSHRKPSVTSIVRKAEFPGNWRLVPKSLGQFPTRFPNHQCHKTNCDRCDIRNRPENLERIRRHETVTQTVTADFDQEEVLIPKRRLDIKSESSDSAIGGSGERWQTKDNQMSLLPPEVNEADILQDMIEPDDSASGCRANEPFPDYSVVSAKIRVHKSFRSELSDVLREFEGNLKQYESTAAFSNYNDGYAGHFVTLGEV